MMQTLQGLKLPLITLSRRSSFVASLLCLLLALLSRQWLEGSMTRHMLLQFPLLALVGFGLAFSLSPRWVKRLNGWNHYGVSGLFATALLLALLMIPRLLDMALTDWRIESAKYLALLFCGAALQLSWRPAGLLLQAFFLGNVLPMMAVVGYLFESSPMRLCNAYLRDDQVLLGQALVWIAALIALVWFTRLVQLMMLREDAALTRQDE
jgi:hypothetical protein